MRKLVINIYEDSKTYSCTLVFDVQTTVDALLRVRSLLDLLARNYISLYSVYKYDCYNNQYDIVTPDMICDIYKKEEIIRYWGLFDSSINKRNSLTKVFHLPDKEKIGWWNFRVLVDDVLCRLKDKVFYYSISESSGDALYFTLFD